MDFDEVIKKVDDQKICFLCSTCLHYHEGEDRELKDDSGQQVCSNLACCGPIWGGGFDYYEGPIKGYLHKWCYLCGRESDKVIFATNQIAPAKIGVCKHCFENHVKKYTARVMTGGYSIIVAELVADKDKHGVISS